MKTKQSGFTLVEIAIVLVIIGLLLGGILKGQELISSARVRNLADSTTGIQAAYFGFIDRYRRVPGDMDAGEAAQAIGGSVVSGGNANGRIDPGAGDFQEPNAAWEHLSKAGFIQGEFNGATTEPTNTGDEAPVNPWNNPMLLGITPDYEGAGPARLHLVIGRGIPVDVLRELDVKVDDSDPEAGVLRASLSNPTVFTGTNNWGGSDTTVTCVTGNSPDLIYDIDGDSQDCNGVFLF